MEYKIIDLPKEKWQGYILPIDYESMYYYDVKVSHKDFSYHIDIEKTKSDELLILRQEDYDFPDKLYQEHWEQARAWGVIIDNQLIAAIETALESWSNRLRITELWVAPEHQKKGLGKKLVDLAKEQLQTEHRRALILETQSCNVNAIEFYRHYGFELVGFDTCAYTNQDIKNKEVRFEFAWFPKAHINKNMPEFTIDVCL